MSDDVRGVQTDIYFYEGYVTIFPLYYFFVCYTPLRTFSIMGREKLPNTAANARVQCSVNRAFRLSNAEDTE